MTKTDGWREISDGNNFHWYYRDGNYNWGDITMKRTDDGFVIKSKICKNKIISEEGVCFRSMAQADLWCEFTRLDAFKKCVENQLDLFIREMENLILPIIFVQC